MENNTIAVSDSKAHISVSSTLIESMTKIVRKVAPWKFYTIRCWRQEDKYNSSVGVITKTEVMEVLDKISPSDVSMVTTFTDNKFKIAESLLSIERMNAVEITDESGDGVVIYKDWP